MISKHQNRGFSFQRFALAAICTLVFTGPLIYAAHNFAKITGVPLVRANRSIRQPSLVVLKGSRVVHLFDGDSLIRSYACDLGSSPVGDKRSIGDGKTPLGRFRIVSKNDNSPYVRFLGFDYPHQPSVESGVSSGLVSDGEAQSILTALGESRCPDWSTALGGGIGLHGRRKGRDWTGGCIAVSDFAIDELFEILRIGDRVEILP